MDTLAVIPQTIGQLLKWVAIHILWMPTKIILSTLVPWLKKVLAKKETKWKLDTAKLNVEREAAKNLPELAAQLRKVTDEMSKISVKYAQLSEDKRVVEDLISVASGNMGKRRKPKHNSNQSKKKKGNNNDSNPEKKIGELRTLSEDADFEK